jgi:hypothetical protein
MSPMSRAALFIVADGCHRQQPRPCNTDEPVADNHRMDRILPADGTGLPNDRERRPRYVADLWVARGQPVRLLSYSDLPRPNVKHKSGLKRQLRNPSRGRNDSALRPVSPAGFRHGSRIASPSSGLRGGFAPDSGLRWTRGGAAEPGRKQPFAARAPERFNSIGPCLSVVLGSCFRRPQPSEEIPT